MNSVKSAYPYGLMLPQSETKRYFFEVGEARWRRRIPNCYVASMKCPGTGGVWPCNGEAHGMAIATTIKAAKIVCSTLRGDLS
jgi:hypothetical protein